MCGRAQGQLHDALVETDCLVALADTGEADLVSDLAEVLERVGGGEGGEGGGRGGGEEGGREGGRREGGEGGREGIYMKQQKKGRHNNYVLNLLWEFPKRPHSVVNTILLMYC